MYRSMRVQKILPIRHELISLSGLLRLTVGFRVSKKSDQRVVLVVVIRSEFLKEESPVP